MNVRTNDQIINLYCSYFTEDTPVSITKPNTLIPFRKNIIKFY